MAVLYRGDVVPQSTGAALDFNLAEILGLAELAHSLSDLHRSLLLLRFRRLHTHVLSIHVMGNLFIAEPV